MSITEEIFRIQNSIREGRFPNETSVTQGIVLPILQSLGWQIYDSRFVYPEYSIGGGRVDLALMDNRNRAIIFIEVKMLGNIEGAEQQLFEYAFHQGVPFLILTDGQEWNFYLPLTQGNYQERKLYKLDLLERDNLTIVEKFSRYLSCDRVVQGNALESAQNDFKVITYQREAEKAIPDAWRSLLENDNETIIDLLIDKVENICGYKPERKSCEKYLESFSIPQPVYRPIEKATQIIPKDPVYRNQNYRIGFTYKGQFNPARSAREVMIEIIKLLAILDPTFLERLSVRAHGDQIRYISRNRMELYPNRPDLCNDKSMAREFLPGWWIWLNFSKKSIDKIIRVAIEVGGIKNREKLEYNLGE